MLFLTPFLLPVRLADIMPNPVDQIDQCGDRNYEVPKPQDQENLFVQEVEREDADVVVQLLRARRAVVVEMTPERKNSTGIVLI